MSEPEPGPTTAWQVQLSFATTAAGDARRWTRKHLDRSGIVDDAADAALLVASELVTNALQHGAPPIELALSCTRTELRLEVCDHAPALPRRRTYGWGAMTGRGLGLIAAISLDWGADPTPGGKVVWARLPRDRAAGAHTFVDHGDTGQDLERGWLERPLDEDAVDIVYRGVPVDVYLRMQEHSDALRREAELFASGVLSAEPEPGLAALLERLAVQLAHPPEQMRAAATRAERAGQPTVDLHAHVSSRALEASARHLELLDAADVHAQAGALLVEPAPDDVVELRNWFHRQLREQLSRSEGP